MRFHLNPAFVRPLCCAILLLVAGLSGCDCGSGTGSASMGPASPAQLGDDLVQDMEVLATGNNKTELHIYGHFDSLLIPGHFVDYLAPNVYMISPGGSNDSESRTRLEVISASPTEIRCKLPAHDEPGGYGNVTMDSDHTAVVTKPVPLTLWTITFTDVQSTDFSGQYVYLPAAAPDFIPTYAQPSGNLTVTTVLKLFVRGDARQGRLSPHRILISEQGWTTKDATVSSVTVSGSATETFTKNGDVVTSAHNTFSREGGASIPLDGTDSRAKIANIYGGIDPAKNQMSLVYSVAFDPLVHIDYTSVPPGSTVGIGPTSGGISFPLNPPQWVFTLDKDYNIPKGSQQTVDATPAGPGYTITDTVSWESQVSNAPGSPGNRSAAGKPAAPNVIRRESLLPRRR